MAWNFEASLRGPAGLVNASRRLASTLAPPIFFHLAVKLREFWTHPESLETFWGSGEQPPLKDNMISFFRFWNSLILHPRHFFSHQFNKEKSPYLLLVILVFGISGVIDRMDKRFIQYDRRGELDRLESVNHWLDYWAIAIAAGALSGIIFYHLGGWFYNLRVRWSQGNTDLATSRFIYLYSSFIAAFPTVLGAIGLTFSSPAPYVPNAEETISEWMTFFLLMGLLYYSVYVSYVGVTTLLNPHKWRARIWFLILPMALYSVALVLAFVALAVGVLGG